MTSTLRPLVDALGDSATRHEAACAIARAVGARELLLFVKDPELDVFLPAPGMPQTLRSARQWQAFLRRCVDTVLVDTLDLGGENVCATGVVAAGCGIVLAGERAAEFPPELTRGFPLLASALTSQLQLHLQSAEAREARQAATQAHELALALDAARAAAAEMNRQLQLEHQQKDQFLAMLAHELRNPLAPMTSATELLRILKAPDSDPRVERQLEIMARQLQQLTHLVDDLLDVSRVSRGLIELRRETLKLREVISAALDSSRPLIESRRHTLVVPRVPDEIHVHADAVRLTQVFANLLNNAAKYTSPGGNIRVEVDSRDDVVQVRIIDDGLGIPTEMLTSIFDLFTQVPGSLDRAPGGLGIGLTLVRTLVQLHGGAVRAESRGPGTGSIFVVTLPLAVARELAPSRPPCEGPRSACGSVMIVDDNHDAAASLAEVLRLLGAPAVVARDGAEALGMAETGPLPDVVLLDIGLPGLDGYEVAREWRRRFGREARLIALTGYGSPEDRRRTAQAGFDAHLVKPVALDQLLPLLRSEHQAGP